MGFFDELKKGIKDVSVAAKNSVEEAKAREAKGASAGTLKPDAKPMSKAQPKPQPKTEDNPNVIKGFCGAVLRKEPDGDKLTFGTPCPVPYDDPRYPFKIEIRFNGVVTFPAGSIEADRAKIDNWAAITLNAGQRAVGKISSMSCPYENIASQNHEIRKAIAEDLKEAGNAPLNVQLNSLTASQESVAKAKEWDSRPDYEKTAELAAAGKAAPAAQTPVEGPTVTCTSCGTACKQGQKFCSNCGAVLGG